MKKFLKSLFLSPTLPTIPPEIPFIFTMTTIFYEPEHTETIFIEPRATRAIVSVNILTFSSFSHFFPQQRFDTKPPEIRRKMSLSQPVLEKEGYVKVSSMLRAETKYRYLIYRDGYLFIYKRKPVTQNNNS
jgi:hypothetical protein